jgi:hypothetical protein
MKMYKALFEGRNCWANLDGICRRLGFVTIRAGRGNDANQAATAMERKLRAELSSMLHNKPEDLPEIKMGEVCEIDEATASGIPRAGCTWYPDDVERKTGNSPWDYFLLWPLLFANRKRAFTRREMILTVLLLLFMAAAVLLDKAFPVSSRWISQ